MWEDEARLRDVPYPLQPTSRVRVQYFILRSEKLKIWAPGYGPVLYSNTVNLDPPCSCAIALSHRDFMDLDLETSMIPLPACAAGSVRAPLYSSVQNSLQSELQRADCE